MSANADCPGLNLGRLAEAWTRLDLSRVFSPTVLPFVRQLVRGTNAPAERQERLGQSLLDPCHLERLVGAAVDFEALHHNIREGVVRGLYIAALQVATGRTTPAYWAGLASPQRSRSAR